MFQETFDKLLNRLSQESDLFKNSEQATKQGMILPILGQLGWNIYNIREVEPEFQVEGGKVDYCLRIGENKAIFIEVKKITEELERHEKQLLDYSFRDGVEIAVLTNGLLWWLYLPLLKGSWHQRRFFAIDIAQQEPSIAARHFIDFLSKDCVKNGSALNHAQSIYASKEKERRIIETIPKAWDKIFQEPDESFLELFSNKVESMSGYRPEIQVLVEFVNEKYSLRGQAPHEPVLPSKDQKIAPKISRRLKRPKVFSSRKPRQRGVKVSIGGKLIEGTSVSELYKKVLVFLYESGYLEKLQKDLPFETSPQRYLISKEPFHQRGNKFVIPVEYKGYYMEAHKAYKEAINALIDLLKCCDLKLQVIESTQ